MNDGAGVKLDLNADPDDILMFMGVDCFAIIYI